MPLPLLDTDTSIVREEVEEKEKKEEERKRVEEEDMPRKMRTEMVGSISRKQEKKDRRRKTLVQYEVKQEKKKTISAKVQQELKGIAESVYTCMNVCDCMFV